MDAFGFLFMIPFHSLLPELAQREVRCLHLGVSPEWQPRQAPELPPDEYAYMELYCEELGCDCRRVFLQVIRKGDRDKVLASIVYGWEKESFYRKRISWDADAEANRVVRGHLDPINRRSEFAGHLLDLFKQFVLDEPYRLRLRRHYRLFKEELARRDGQPPVGPAA